MGLKAKNLRNWHNLHQSTKHLKFIHTAAELTNQRRRGVQLQYGQRLHSSTSHPSDYNLKKRYGFNTSTTTNY